MNVWSRLAWWVGRIEREIVRIVGPGLLVDMGIGVAISAGYARPVTTVEVIASVPYIPVAKLLCPAIVIAITEIIREQTCLRRYTRNGALSSLPRPKNQDAD